jgi:hypothetical protein
MKTVLQVGLIGCLFCGLILTTADRPLRAEPPSWGAGCWYGGGYGYDSPYERDHIPFFAMHPPVYYSYPVARTYGYSPFAYPPGVMTPADDGGPKEIINPHVPPSNKPSDKTKPSSGKTAEIVNPYVGATLVEQEK